MLCYCGRDLGDVGETTTGLCPDCGQSIWMQAARRRRPNSKAIAASYNQTGQSVCEHQQSPCISRCGVRLVGRVWTPIPLAERQAWFSRVMAHEKKDFTRPEFGGAQDGHRRER